MATSTGLVAPSEKLLYVPINSQKEAGFLQSLYNNPVASSLTSVYNAFQSRRDALGLSNPGDTERISKEAENVLIGPQHSFTGLRAEITKALSLNPLFQLSHSLAPEQHGHPYSLGLIYGTNSLFCHGSIDSDQAINGRFNFRWTPRLTTKTTIRSQPSTSPNGGATQLILSNVYTGNDFTAKIDAQSPSILDGMYTGAIQASFLQSVTPSLALGMEIAYSRPAAHFGPETIPTYLARYRGSSFIATGQVVPMHGVVNATFWRKINEKIEAGVDLNIAPNQELMMMGGPPSLMGTANLGLKWQFYNSLFRTQVDTTGKLMCHLEKKQLGTPVTFNFYGEIDHGKNTSKLGMGITLEMADESFNNPQANNDAVQPPY